MQFPDPLVRGTLVQRYKRFLSDITLESGETITAHVANPGSMIGLTDPGSEVWLSPNRNPKAKLDWRWELVRVGDHLVGVNTAHPNNLVAEALDLLPEEFEEALENVAVVVEAQPASLQMTGARIG